MNIVSHALRVIVTVIICYPPFSGERKTESKIEDYPVSTAKAQLKDEVFVPVSGCDAPRDGCVTGHDVTRHDHSLASDWSPGSHPWPLIGCCLDIIWINDI